MFIQCLGAGFYSTVRFKHQSSLYPDNIILLLPNTADGLMAHPTASDNRRLWQLATRKVLVMRCHTEEKRKI